MKKGDLKFVLHGEKLRGEFALVKTAQDEKSWLLIKKRDRYATPESVLAEDRSVASGRTLEEVAAAAGLLEKILPRVTDIRFSDHVREEGRLFFAAVTKKGPEGILAKHSQGRYQPGVRSPQWLKVKQRLTQEAVIAGFTEPRGTRRHFGALVLGAFAGDRLEYIGRVGGGFGARSLRDLRARLDPLIRKKSPFRTAPAVNEPVTWVKPDLVCEVAFAEWTGDGVMRQPVFLRLREDKAPREAVREQPVVIPRAE